MNILNIAITLAVIIPVSIFVYKSIKRVLEVKKRFEIDRKRVEKAGKIESIGVKHE
jgi:hypothetical protein